MPRETRVKKQFSKVSFFPVAVFVDVLTLFIFSSICSLLRHSKILVCVKVSPLALLSCLEVEVFSFFYSPLIREVTNHSIPFGLNDDLMD